MSGAVPSSAPVGRFGWRRALTMYAGFAAGVLVVTWPLASSPGSLWPPHHDARVFTWVMASMARGLVSRPESLFHGNAFYPSGETLAFTELLLPPSILGAPGFLWGNPVLTYNLLLLLLWPLNGLAMAWVAHALTGSRAAASLAGTIFCLSPYFTEYYLEFQMLLAALFPVVLLAWVRWLETQEPRWLAGALGGLTLQALTSWYYAIILGLALATLAGGFLTLRWRGWQWRRDLVALAAGGVLVGAILLPFALPYVTVHREYQYERSLEETATHYADVASFFEGGRRSLLYRVAPSGRIPETSAFVGFVGLALAGASIAWLRTGRARARPALWLARVLLVALVAGLLGAVLVAPFQPVSYRLGPMSGRLRPRSFLDVSVLAGVGLLLVRGFTVSRRPTAERRLDEGDWVRLLLLLTGVFALLALGPVLHAATRDFGPGPYMGLYHWLWPLHVVRVTARFAVVCVAALALLAALGVRHVEDRSRAQPGRVRPVLTVLGVILALEYAVWPAAYESVDPRARPVDTVLRADPEPAAVLEWPTNVPQTDADAMVRSLAHGKLLVNGLSGVVPAIMSDLSSLLTTPATVFPGEEARRALRRIYPLRYLVVRLGDPAMTAEWRPTWVALRRDPPPPLQFVGTFGDEDLYRLVALPERGTSLARTVSYDFLRTRPVLRAALRPLAEGPDLAQWVEVSLNGRPEGRLTLDRPARPIELTPPFHRAAPNVIGLDYRYRRPTGARDDRYRIGTTGGISPRDIRVVSAGRPHGNVGSIQLNGVEHSPQRRGYNLAALDADGRVVGLARFDTFFRSEAAGELAAWVAALPRGTIVAGAAQDEASGLLTAEAVSALRQLGAAGDLRGRFRESHAFVGVKGAPPGSAVEELGPRRVEVRVGHVELVAGEDGSRLGFDLTDFALTGTGDAAAR